MDAPLPADGPLRALLAERGLLLAYIQVILPDAHAAEDVLQDALLLAMRTTFRDIDHARAWIRVTARNLALNEGRRRQRRAGALPADVLDDLEPLWDEQVQGPAMTERMAALRACCAQLPARARQLLQLRFERNLDGAGIGAAIGRPLNTVYVSLSRIYRRLAACIGRRLGTP